MMPEIFESNQIPLFVEQVSRLLSVQLKLAIAGEKIYEKNIG